MATALVAAGCADDGTTSPVGERSEPTGSDDVMTIGATTVPDPDSPDGAGGSGARFVRALRPFDDCDSFLEQIKAEARERVGPYGLDGDQQYWLMDDMVAVDMATDDMAEEPAVPAAEMAEEPAAEEPADGAFTNPTGDGSFTGTNVQEAGVDEPDIVKTDGDRILTVSDNVLAYVDISSGDPVVTDQLQLDQGWGHELFFSGDRALLFTNGGDWGGPMPVDVQFADAVTSDIAPGDEFWGPAALIVEIDLSDPGDLRVSSTMRIEGQYLSARAIGDHVRLAVSSSPNRLPWLYPQSSAGEDRAEEANRQIVDESTLEDWIPTYQLVGPDGETSGSLISCDRLHHPADFSGFDVVSVIDLDLSSGLEPAVDAVGVLASGQTVYSSSDRFYVATTKWVPPSLDDGAVRAWSEDYETEIHAFAIAPGEPTTYVASGSVRGSLLNQFSLDEHEGDLRIVHTDGSPWNGGDASETFLTVLREDGDRLTPIGSVGGLGKGEQLYSARLMGDIGFAVTFRQVDPLYVLDLSDPTDPRVVGELKIPGFSTYLHPLGDGRVLGIGKDATENGGVTGLKLSLFDVSDPSDPREISVWTLPNAESVAEWDHRAFQMWGSTAIVPVQSWMGTVNGAMLFDIGDTITEIGQVSHAHGGTTPTSDCRAITIDQLTPEMSDLWWMAQEGHLQVCGPDAVGGWPGSVCETMSADDSQWWFADDATRETDLAAIDLGPDDTVEVCWPDGGYQEAILRSLVADGTLYTVSRTTLQANDLATLAVIGQVPIR